MARKKQKLKNIKLEQTELTPVTIGMFESRKKSSIGTVLILGVFILAVIFLPEISDYVNQYLNKNTTPTVRPPVIKPSPNDPDDPQENDDNFTAYNQDLKITNDEITVNNFKIDPEKLEISYEVTNNFSSSQNLEELNYYLEIYNGEKTLLERIKLVDDRLLNSGAFATFKRNIKSESATTIGYIAILKKTVNDYPIFELKSDEEGNGSLVCAKEHEIVTYKFKDEKLKEVTSRVSYLVTDSDYQTFYEEDKEKANSYNNKLGVISTFFEYETGYNINSSINLSEAERMYLFNADSFKLNTEPKVVKFEMEAQGFTCNNQ